MKRCFSTVILGLAIALQGAWNADAAFAQSGGQVTPPDLSELVVPPNVIGDNWTVLSQDNEPTLFRAGYSPPAIAGYLVTYAQNPQVEATVAMYGFADHAGALASLGDPYDYWGHGNTTLVPLTGLGDAQSFRAYGVGKGPNAGITFVEGPVVVYVRAEDDTASDTSGVDAICDSLASAADGLLLEEQ
jgi:hypothetical protein